MGFLLLLGTLLQGADSIPERTIPRSLGFNIHIMGPDRDLDAIRDSGVKFVRKDMFWNHVERSRGKYDFGGYERLLDGLEKRGIRALFILCYGNELYPKAEDTEEGREAYARYAAEAVRHFKGRRVLWEIWNEPNVKHFWKGPGDHNSDAFADQYVALVKKAVPAMRAADPQCTILGGATSCLWHMSFKWLDRCFKQGLLQSGIDALSVHPYGFARPELCIQEGYGRLREMMEENGASRDFPVLNSEVGYDAHAAYLGPKELRLQHQAWHFVRQHLVDLMCDVRLSIWYNWNDDPGFRIVQPDMTELPVYAACRTLAAQMEGRRFVKRLPAGSELDFLLLFEKETGDRVLVAWTTPAGRDDTPEKAQAREVRLPVAASSTSLTVCDLYGKQGPVAVSNDAITLVLSGSPLYVHLPGRKPAASSKVPSGKPLLARPEAVAARDAALLARLKEELRAGRNPRFRWTATGGWADLVEIGPKDELRIVGKDGGARVAWSTVSLADRRSLAVATVRKGRAEDHALAAFYMLALGEKERAQSHLDKAGAAADQVKTAFR